MKYACLFKNLDELNVSDFDDEVLEEYGTLSILEVSEDGKDAMVSYKKPNFEEVISTIGELCSDCGYKNEETKNLKLREWICPDCGSVHDRDINAARNILKEGMRIAL